MPRRGENIRKRKDGRWEARYIKYYDSNGKAVYGYVYAKTYFEVKKKQNESVEKITTKALPIKEHEATFREVLFLWLDNNKIKLKPQTYAKYLNLIENHIIPDLGHNKIKKVDSNLINNFLFLKSANGRLDGKGGLSPSYLQSIAFIITSAIAFSTTEGYRVSFIGEIRTPPKRKYKSEINVLTHEEQGVLEKYLSQEKTDKHIGVFLSLYTGLRIGEVCGLRWEDVDLDNKTIHIRNTVERITNIERKQNESKTLLILCDTKTISSNRIIPIPSKVYEVLSHYQKNTGFVIKGHSYEYTDPRTYQIYFQNCLKRSNLRSVNYHVLRHTFATRCIESGMDVKTLSELLGHASVNITLNTYVHSSLEHKRSQIELLNSIRGQ